MSQPIARPSGTQPSAGLTDAQIGEVAAARRRVRRIRRAAALAGLSGWTMAVFAALTLLGAMIGASAVGLALGVALGAIAGVELWGRGMLLRFDLRGPRVLAANQVCLGAVLVAYGAWSLYHGLHDPAAAQLRSGDPDVDAMVGDLARTVNVAVYGTLIVAGIVAPGLTALYYHSRGRLIRAFLVGTPEWVVRVLRA